MSSVTLREFWGFRSTLRIIKSKVFFVILAVNASAVFFTWLMWRFVFADLAWMGSMRWMADVTFYLVAWPILLSSAFGYDPTNHSSGLLLQLVGWNALAIAVWLTLRQFRRAKKRSPNTAGRDS